jgi:hypothetical protein
MSGKSEELKRPKTQVPKTGTWGTPRLFLICGLTVSYLVDQPKSVRKNRLLAGPPAQGFGLAHEIDVGPCQVPVGEYCFRPSRRGLSLLKLIGEEVANTDIYRL